MYKKYIDPRVFLKGDQGRMIARLALEPPKITDSGLPDGHLEKINKLLASRGKTALTADQVIVRPIRLTGNQLTDQYTKFPDGELESFATQINAAGAPMLSAHVTDDTPLGTFYDAHVTSLPDGTKWLDTYVYWIPTDEGIELAQQIDAGIINEASIGFMCNRPICSITGMDYRSSPYWRGQEYDVTDTATGLTTRKMCFVWMFDCEIIEGSACYRGAHPGTQVGGVLAARAAMIQLSLGNDAQNALSKTPPPVAQTVPTPTQTQQGAGGQGEAMNPKFLLALGLLATATEAEVLHALETRNMSLETLQRLTATKTPDEAIAVVNAWQASHNALSGVIAERDALQLEQTKAELEGLIAGASTVLTTPDQIAWARTQTPVALKAFLAVATPHPALASKPVTEPKDGAEAAKTNTNLSGLTDDERVIVQQTGVTEAEFLQSKTKLAAQMAQN